MAFGPRTRSNQRPPSSSSPIARTCRSLLQRPRFLHRVRHLQAADASDLQQRQLVAAAVVSAPGVVLRIQSLVAVAAAAAVLRSQPLVAAADAAAAAAVLRSQPLVAAADAAAVLRSQPLVAAADAAAAAAVLRSRSQPVVVALAVVYQYVLVLWSQQLSVIGIETATFCQTRGATTMATCPGTCTMPPDIVVVEMLLVKSLCADQTFHASIMF
jgi:hypothetical protein